MRRALLFVPLILLAAACGDGDDGPASASVDTTAAVAPSTTALVKPEVELPSTLPTTLVISDLTTGTGPQAKVGDSVVVHYVGVRSQDGTEFDNSYDRGEPFEVSLGAGQVIQGWEQGLIGVQQGTRRQLDIPADLAYGDSGSGDVIAPGDAITFVVDVVVVLPGSTADQQPEISLEGAANVAEVQSEDLVVGTGAVPVDGGKFAVQIMLFRADTGELLNSTWGTSPVVFDFTSDTDTYPGIIAAANGMQVGGRRQSQVPFALIFDGLGNETIQLPASVDVVLVMDLIAVY
jgi:peptidylprolyl isomerase